MSIKHVSSLPDPGNNDGKSVPDTFITTSVYEEKEIEPNVKLEEQTNQINIIILCLSNNYCFVNTKKELVSDS